MVDFVSASQAVKAIEREDNEKIAAWQQGAQKRQTNAPPVGQ